MSVYEYCSYSRNDLIEIIIGNVIGFYSLLLSILSLFSLVFDMDQCIIEFRTTLDLSDLLKNAGFYVERPVCNTLNIFL